MLWNIIRDWFVQYVFGGTTSQGDIFSGMVGTTLQESGNTSGEAWTGSCWLPLKGVESGGIFAYMNFGDWLSTTATIITLIAGCVLLFFVLKWLFKLFAGMISGVGR